MGYFDNIDNKMESIQEVGEIDRLAGNGFWFSIAAFGVILHGIVICSIFKWQLIYLDAIFVLSIVFGFIGLIYALKAGKAAAMVREKSPLKNMALAYNLLWIVLNILSLFINTWFSIKVIIANL